VKGQLTVLVPQSEVTYSASGRPPGATAPIVGTPGGGASMNARSDGLVIGNMMERGNWSLDVNEEVRQRVVDAAIRFFSAMRPPRRGVPFTRSEAPQVAPSVDSFFDLES